MTTLSKTLNVLKSKTLQTFMLDKTSENIIEAVMTLLTVALVIPFVNIMQNIPVTMIEMSVYIVLVFLGMTIIRLVRDLDDAYTVDELAEKIIEVSDELGEMKSLIVTNPNAKHDMSIDERLTTIEKGISDVIEMVKNDIALDEEFIERLNNATR